MNKVTLGHFTLEGAMQRRINFVLSSGRLSYGTESREYERLFAEKCDCDYGVVSNSGTSALVIALQTMKEIHGWKDGDEVIVPALTFVATVNAVLHCGLLPILVDVDPYTYNIDAWLISEKISERTRCIIPVHLFGNPADMENILPIAEKNNLRIIEDCCEAFGASIFGKRVGSFGDIGCFSTYVGHHIVTGVGGMSTTSNPTYASRMRSLVNHGIDVSELPAGEHYEPSHLSRRFLFTSIGHSFRITEMEAAIGIEQLLGSDDNIRIRRKNADWLSEQLSSAPALQLPMVTSDHFSHSYMVYPIVLKDSNAAHRDGLMAHLRKNGIECRTMVPLTNQPCYGFREEDWPEAKYINSCGLYVGCHNKLKESDLNYMAEIIAEFLNA